ncbi:DUF305 domain-containing protein [Geodermatophilus sp. DSM 44513]|uniref:DUF305 domain-containing protein n=1 Tax=Geodermatophilus sp. DSM 44513 TaxID=1528104 RepID=UPI0028F6D8AF|nr:DUF305 domain-containing protein [Geodermatophilus sp. DSM 44513]WNV74806.1 DUF305 domain-containing protein [Geodermatophilus sp. DSM 44513]
MTHTPARLPGLTGALLAGALLLTGCSGGAGHEGMAGMSGSTADSSAGAPADPSGTAAEADVAFAQGMLPHHEQAVEMARLAADRAADPRVQDLATRIETAQAPEIETLSGWLAAWGAEETGSTGTDHGSMGHGGDAGGMMSEEDVTALADASGADFDRAFLEMMLAHHRGAVQMAETEVADGQDADAVALAEEIRGSQTAEIAEMEQLLAELGG